MLFFSSTLVSTFLSALAAPVIGPRQNCPDVSVSFTRGTGERCTLGAVVGPRLKPALQGALGGQRLNLLESTMLRTLWGCQEGATTTTANSVTAKANACPNTKIAVSGYAKDAQVLISQQSNCLRTFSSR
ncbi:hypothetical protein FPV67DRAFT_721630 [Lyophyllum atratum]|nr:hypothetical protein FPV67DRAFT_721630 [Lyophyllum atratum]